MRRLYGIDHETPGVMERLTAPDDNILVTTKSLIYVSFGWTKEVQLPYKVTGPWCTNNNHPVGYYVDGLYAWLANETSGHWYSYFENKTPYNFRQDNSARVVLLFESAADAMIAKLSLDLRIKEILI